MGIYNWLNTLFYESLKRNVFHFQMYTLDQSHFNVNVYNHRLG